MYLHLYQRLKVALDLLVPVLAPLSLYHDPESSFCVGAGRAAGCIRFVLYLHS